jgi:hypothetical protein
MHRAARRHDIIDQPNPNCGQIWPTFVGVLGSQSPGLLIKMFLDTTSLRSAQPTDLTR